MRFVDAKSYVEGTKLTGIIESLGETYPLNDMLWNHANDVKFAYGKITITAATATLDFGNGIYSVTRNAAGTVTVNWNSTFDTQAPAVFAMALSTSGAIADCRIGMADINTNSTTAQKFMIYDNAQTLASATSETLYVLAIGIDADTTNITDNSSQTPLNASMLNRCIALGHYKNPSPLKDVALVLTAGYVLDNPAGGGVPDTLTSISNANSFTRNGAGDYEIDLTVDYLYTPITFCTAMTDVGNTFGYCVSRGTATTLYIETTDSQDDAASDVEFSFMALGFMEVG